MPLNLGNAFVSNSLPKDRAFLFVECVNLVRVFRIIFNRRDVAVESESRFVFPATNRGGHKNFVAHTTGLEWARPGIAVFQRTFVCADASHFTGCDEPSTTPVAPGPRNWGQFCSGFCASAVLSMKTKRTMDIVIRFISLEPRDYRRL